MRYFEMPKMNVSMFETENVVTVVSGQPTQSNQNAAQNALVNVITGGDPGEGREATQNIFTFNY